MRRSASWLIFAMLLAIGYAVPAADETTTASRPVVVSPGQPTVRPFGRDRLHLNEAPEWYRSEEAIRIGDNYLLYQRADGGWPKNTNMMQPLSEQEKADLLKVKNDLSASTIDNGATYQQLRYLAKLHTGCRLDRFRDAFNLGIDYLLAAQYPNGGWPQFTHHPGYYTHITYNDNAMIGVMTLLRDMAAGGSEFAFTDASRRTRANAAVEKGIDCILKTQVRVQGTLTVWCAQHDEKTMAPAPARTYELISLSGSESVAIIEFLMEIDHPSPEIVQAVQAAVRWFDRVKIPGLIQEWAYGPEYENGRDKIVYDDPAGPTMWARFYEIGTNRPMFCGRDGIKKYKLSDIEYERRTEYGWYGYYAALLLDQDYPAWQKKWAPTENVLAQPEPARTRAAAR